MSLFTEDKIIFVENLKQSAKNFPGMNTEYSKFAGYKFNVQKSLNFPITSNEQSEFDI